MNRKTKIAGGVVGGLLGAVIVTSALHSNQTHSSSTVRTPPYAQRLSILYSDIGRYENDYLGTNPDTTANDCQALVNDVRQLEQFNAPGIFTELQSSQMAAAEGFLIDGGSACVQAIVQGGNAKFNASVTQITRGINLVSLVNYEMSN